MSISTGYVISEVMSAGSGYITGYFNGQCLVSSMDKAKHYSTLGVSNGRVNTDPSALAMAHVSVSVCRGKYLEGIFRVFSGGRNGIFAGPKGRA